MRDFKDKVCIVTGATSGIGYAIANEIAARDGQLLLVGRRQELGLELTQRLNQDKLRAHFLAADLSDPAAAQKIAAEAMERFGRIDVLVNNAGILKNGTILECSDEQWAEVLDVNLNAAFRLTRAVLPFMLDRRRGSIVNVASDWALMGARQATAYCVSKAALAQLTRCVALDYASAGIRVNAVCPGDTDTPMLDQAYDHPERAWKVQTLAATIPLERVALPSEIAKAVAFLASDDASFMTGSLLAVDGGTSAQ